MSSTLEKISAADAALERRLERLGLAGHPNEWTDRYLLCNHLLSPASARERQKFEATSRFIRDLIAHRWAKTQSAREQANPKRVHYLSMEFLLGRTLRNSPMPGPGRRSSTWRVQGASRATGRSRSTPTRSGI